MNPGNLYVGMELPPWKPPAVTRTDIVRYQGASGDFDAAHHSDEHARSFGYPGVFSLGMLHAGMLAAYLTRFFPPEAIRRFRSRFVAIVYPDDVLTYSGAITDVRSEGDIPWADVHLVCSRDSDGVAVLQGDASIRLTQ